MCVLSLPLDLSVSDFCEFLGAYLEQVQQMRFLQREGARAPSLVVISFKEQSLADQFFQHFNAKPVRFPRPCRELRVCMCQLLRCPGLPGLLLRLLIVACLQFSSLEPLDVCHIVFVKDLVIAEGPSDRAHLPSPGTN